MDVATALRKIKRQFGDEYNVIVVDEDIYYWIHEAELDIVRQTASNDIQIQVSANTFPVMIQGNVMVKRVSINGKALSYTTRNELDSLGYSINYEPLVQLNPLDGEQIGSSLTSEGTPTQWYWESNRVYLFPKPSLADTFTVDIIYCRVPPEMTEAHHTSFTVPEVFHEDVVKYCIARAHNKNMNWKAAEAEMESYDRNVSTRRNESQSADVPLYKGIDPDDYDLMESWL